MSGVSEATRTLGTVLAGFFVHGLLDVTYVIQIVFAILAMVLIWFMKEPSIKASRDKNPSLTVIIETVRETFKSNPNLLKWLLTSQIICVLMCMFYFYYQNELTALTSWQISLVMLCSSGINIGAVFLASRIGEKCQSVVIFPFIVGLTGLLYLVAILKAPAVYVVIYLLTDGLYALFLPIFTNDLQHNIPSDVRATLLSVNSMFFSLSMIIIFPLTGFVIDYLGFSKTFLWLGLLLLALVPVLLKEYRYLPQKEI